MKTKFSGKCYSIEDNKEIYVAYLPGIKQICLYEIIGNKLEVLAFIKNKNKARKILNWLDSLICGHTVWFEGDSEFIYDKKEE